MPASMPLQITSRSPIYAQLSGSCAAEVKPTVAVIAGGVAVGGLKPVDAAEDLDKQLAVIRKYVEESHGQLILLERVRTLKTPSPNAAMETDPPFQVVQRLHAEFPADAPVDAILQRLLELGFDRFGETVLNSNNSRRENVVRYRLPDLDSKLRDMEQSCAADAWKKWCATPAAKGVSKSDEPPPDLQMQNLSIRSTETVLLPDGGTNRWVINYSRNQRTFDPPDLLGNITLHLTGSMNLNYSYARDEKP
jgi:hypothetical protein